jgi:hypothetical protein
MIKKSFSEVFSNYKYIIISTIIAFIFIILNSIILNFVLILNNPRLIYPLIVGGLSNIHIASLITLTIISLLSGILVSMVTYKITTVKILNKKTTGLSGIAILLGTLVPTCSLCGFGILALLGYGGLLLFLPFAGLELAWLSIILLIIAIFMISKQIATKTCKL